MLSDPAAVSPSFSVDLPGTYAVQLVVNDGLLDSTPDSVVITSNSIESDGSSSSGGGGCTLNRGVKKTDPLLPLLFLLAVTCLGLRSVTEFGKDCFESKVGIY